MTGITQPICGPICGPAVGAVTERVGVAAPSLENYGPQNPLYAAHRGGSLLYPENTMIAFRSSFATGHKALETDVATLSDGAMGIMHDDTVDRTTDGTGNVVDFDTAGWQALHVDAGNWFGGGFGNDIPVPFASELINEFKGRAIFLIDAKSGGTGATLLAAMQAAGVPTTQYMAKATDISELTDAIAAGYQTLLTVGGSTTELPDAQAAGVKWIGLDISTASDATITTWVNAGFKASIFTVRRRYQRDRYLALGVSMMMCEDPGYISTSVPSATTDNFASQTWQPGMVDKFNGYGPLTRGRFVAPDKWELPLDGANNTSVLQGWACPVKGDPNCNNFTMDFKVTFGETDGGGATRNSFVFLGKTDLARDTGNAPSVAEQGFNFIQRKSGDIQIYKISTTASTQVATVSTTTIATDQEVPFRIVITPTSVSLSRLDGSGAVVATASYANTDMAFVGGYIHLGRTGMRAGFRGIAIS